MKRKPSKAESRATENAYAKLEAQADITAHDLVDAAARRYALQPRYLDNIEPGLFALTPLALSKRLIEICSGGPRPFSLNNAVQDINRAGAILYARRLLEIEMRNAR